MIKQPRSLWAQLCVSLSLASGCMAVQAGNVTLTGWQFGNGGVVNSNLYAGWAGGFTGTLTGFGAYDNPSFSTYCIELAEHFSFSTNAMSNYTVVDGNNYFGNIRANHMARLMTYVAEHPAAVDSANESTSLQLAIWNIVYDDDFNLNVGGAFSDNSSFANYANTLLAGAEATTQSRFNVYALQRAGTQDFLLTARIPQVGDGDGGGGVLSEPLSSALAGVGLLGALWVKRRRARS